MPYRSDRVGVAQMFDELVAAGRTRHAAAVELGNALSDRAIILNFAGEVVIEEIASIAQCLRDFAVDPTYRPPGIGSARWIFVMGQAEADRMQFEAACQLRPSALVTAEAACGELILRLRQGPRLKKEELRFKAKTEIRGLSDKEFDRAWRAHAGEWAAQGRPKKTVQ